MKLDLAANAIMSTRSRAVVYRAASDSDGVPARAILREGAAEARAGRSQLVVYAAEATVFRALSPVRFGRIEIGDTAYEIAEILRSPTPGLIDLGLSRISGPQIVEDRFGTGRAILLGLGREITLDGRHVRAQVSQRGVLEETNSGQPVETIRTIVSVADDDAEGVAHGAPAIVDGETFRVRVALPNGSGLTLVVLE